MSEKQPKHYVNNKDFLNALVAYKKACDVAKENNKPDPQIPNYVGECFLKIAEHLSRKPNFISYSFRDEMISDGIENCLMYFRNFDETKSTNPFAYFTAAVTNSFVRVINIEKRNQNIRDDILEINGMNPSYSRTGAGEHEAALKRHNEDTASE